MYIYYEIHFRGVGLRRGWVVVVTAYTVQQEAQRGTISQHWSHHQRFKFALFVGQCVEGTHTRTSGTHSLVQCATADSAANKLYIAAVKIIAFYANRVELFHSFVTFITPLRLDWCFVYFFIKNLIVLYLKNVL